MQWDVNSLMLKLDSLSSRIKEVKDPGQRFMLNNDIASLKKMINFKLQEDFFSFTEEEFAYPILDRKAYDSMVSFLQTIVPDLMDRLSALKGIRIPFYLACPKMITEKERLFLSEDFLSKYDPSLLEVYEKMRKENRIEINKSPLEGLTNRGICYTLMTQNEPYIYVKKNRWISHVSTLLHELGHTPQYANKNSAIDIQRCMYSVFMEAYPIFLQYCFIDYLKNTEYKKIALMEECFMLDTLFIYYENYLYKFSEIPKANYNNDNCLQPDGFSNLYYMLRLVMSELLALKWRQMAHLDFDKTMAEVRFINQNFDKITVEELYNKYGTQEFEDAVLYNLQHFQRQLTHK